MIVAQRKIHHRADHDLAGHHHRAVLDLVHPQNPGLRRVQDRGGHQRAVDAAVGDGEAAALHFGHAQLAIAGAKTQLGDLLFNRGKAHLVGVAQHRHHEAGGRADGDPHMDVVLVDHILTVDLGVDLGHFLQRMGAGLDEERHEAEFDPVLFLERILVGGAQVHHAGHVDLIIGGQHGGGVLGVFQAAGDGGAQAGHLDPFLAGGVVGGDGSAGDGGGGGHRRGDRGRGGHGAGDIFLHHPAIAARALHLISGQAGLGHRLFRGGGIFDILGGGGFRRLSLWCRGRSALGDDGQPGIGVHRGALCRDDLGQHARHWRGHFDRDLVGFQLAQHFVLFHRIAGLLEPGRDRRFRHAFAERGHHHIRHHLLLPMGEIGVSRARRRPVLAVRPCGARRGRWRGRRRRRARHSGAGFSPRRSGSAPFPVPAR